MEKIIKQIEKETGLNNLKQMSWPQIVDSVVLPKLTGGKDRRFIDDRYMNFLANNATVIWAINKNVANTLFEIALQRLDCGAVRYKFDFCLIYLHNEYWPYSSLGDENQEMTEGCYNFIMQALETCLKHGNDDVKSHALKIVFELIKNISPNGEVFPNYKFLGEFEAKALDLFNLSKRLAEEYASYTMLYKKYARPNQWKKHKLWFGKNYYKLNLNKFFKDTHCLKGNLIQRMRQRRAIKNELKRIAAYYG